MDARVDSIEVLKRVSKVIASKVGLDKMLRTVARETARLVEADACSILLLDEGSDLLVFREAHGLSWKELERITFKVGEGIAGWVARHQRPACVADVSRDRRFLRVEGQKSRFVSMLCVPLVVRARTIGVISVTHDSRPGAFGKSDQDLLALLARQVSLDIENHRLYELSVTDGLTGAYNHKFLLKRLREETSAARRHRRAFSLAMIDVDHFKKINDTWGHPTGDRILIELTALVKRNMRLPDLLARYGGEEFSLVLPDTPKAGAVTIAERLRSSVERHVFVMPDGKHRLTVSIGVAEHPTDADDRDGLVARADQALYVAKREGRNRVVAAEDERKRG
ncbi:MAG: sensor domain-containing diguanylate cyclase [Planctomycetes bacterium]|nr:sensor domain-containing diguanylate cyclase [Planctomycetota bacterium]